MSISHCGAQQVEFWAPMHLLSPLLLLDTTWWVANGWLPHARTWHQKHQWLETIVSHWCWLQHAVSRVGQSHCSSSGCTSLSRLGTTRPIKTAGTLCPQFLRYIIERTHEKAGELCSARRISTAISTLHVSGKRAWSARDYLSRSFLPF
jgi:hypothetical protein